MLTVAKESSSSALQSIEKVDSWTHSKSNLFVKKHLWAIDHFSFRLMILTSPPFKLKLPDKEVELALLVSPNSNESVNVAVKVLTKDVSLNTKLKLGLITKTGSIKILYNREYALVVQHGATTGSNIITRYDLFNKRSENYSPLDRLTVYCELSVVCESVIEKSMDLRNNIGRTVSQDVQSLFETKEYSDFDLLVDGKSIKVHKSILGARSPVFAALMPISDTKMEVNDLSYEAMVEFLRYMYTDQANVNNISQELLLASIKYEMAELKSLCYKNIVSKMDDENAANYLKFAHENNLEDLKATVLNYFQKHGKAIMKTDGFQELNTEYHLLVIDHLVDALSL